MFYIHGDITIESAEPAAPLAAQVARALSIPPFQLDTSGRYEGDEVYVSSCLGLDFELAKDDPPATTAHLTVNADVDQQDFDGSEREVDAVRYLVALLRRAGLAASPRDRELLYG